MILREGKLARQARSNNPVKKSGSGVRNKTGAPKRDDTPPQLERSEAAEYLAGMLKGLKEVANSAEMRFLGYLIEVAMEEARAERARADSR